MDVTVQDISAWALDELNAMAKRDVGGYQQPGVYRSHAALYREIGALAGVSRETVRQFHLGTKPNLTASNLDKLVTAIKAAKRLRAA